MCTHLLGSRTPTTISKLLLSWQVKHLRLTFLLVSTLVLCGCRDVELGATSARPCLWTSDKRSIPEGGIWENPQAQSPEFWKPETVESDFRRLYKALLIYRQEFGGLPVSLRKLESLGIVVDGKKIDSSDYGTPDFKFADRHDARLGDIPKYQYSVAFGSTYIDTRRPIPIALCNIYARVNQKWMQNCQNTMHLDGFVMVLWSDGKIERVPHGKLMTIDRKGSREHPTFLPNDPILPKDGIPLIDFLKLSYGDRVTADTDAIIGN